MRKLYKYILPVLMALSMVSCDEDDVEVVHLTNQDPVVTIESISPDRGYVGNEFTITGANFGILLDDVKVFVGDKEMNVVSCEDGTIKAKVTEGATAGRVSVIVYGQKVETELMYDVLGEPGITEIDPVYGFIGDEITFKGHDLGVGSNFYNVLFNGKEESAIFASEPTNESFTVKVPEGAASGAIKLKIVDKDVTVSPQFTVLTRAVLEKLSPAQGFGGSEIIVTGKNLNPTLLEKVTDLKAIEVYFKKGKNRYGPADIIGDVTDTEIRIKAPADLEEGDYDISVSTSFEKIEETLAFKVLPKPSVTAVSPAKGYIGAEVKFDIANLNTSVENIEVKFGEAIAKDVRINESGSLIVKVPAESPFGSVDLSLSILGVNIPMGEFGKFEVMVSPVIRAVASNNIFDEKAVQAGNMITITGQGLQSSDITEAIYNGQSLSSVTVVSDSKITALIPDECEAGEGVVILKFDGVETDVVSEDKLNMLKAGSDVSDYILTNAKQPFISKEGIAKGHCTPVGWKFNYGAGNNGFCHDESKLETPGEGLYMNEQGGLLVIQSGWDRLSKKMNGKMFQTFTIPQGTYDVVIEVVELSTSGGGRKKAGLFISKGGAEQAPNMDAGGNWTEDTNIIASANFYMPGEIYNENYRDQRFTIENVAIDYEGETTLGFAVHFDSNRTIKVSSIKVLLK